MEQSRTQRLQQILKRLGQAVQGSVVRAKDVRACLDELHQEGWSAVMMLETTVVCRDDTTLEVEDGTMRLHVDPTPAQVSYRIDANDAAWLSSLGISPSRHRSPARARSDKEQQLPPTE